MKLDAEAVAVSILRERPDGSGVVSMPLAAVGELVGHGGDTFSAEDLRAMAANFRAWGRPVPIGSTEHLPFMERSGPAAGFIDSVSYLDGTLWGVLDLGPGLFAQMKRREWRSFSVEVHRKPSPVVPESTDGWVLVGGILTNRPASAVEGKLAASAISPDVAQYQRALTFGEREERDMADEKTVSLAHHESTVGAVKAELATATSKLEATERNVLRADADMKALREENEALRAEVASTKDDKLTATAQANRLDAQYKAAQAAVRALEVKITELTAKIKEAESATVSGEVKQIVLDAVAAGVPPAVFDGYEANPGEWMGSKYASLEAFREQVGVLRGIAPKRSASVPVKSGHDPAKGGDPILGDRERAARVALGLKVSYEGVRTAEEAQERFAAAQLAAAAK